ncbi:hypothetical protein AF2641_04615 [Anoxybacillus flavithermus]|nr:hypothetical protein AF2641_04615 [Anoxybacillus flavithermus]
MIKSVLNRAHRAISTSKVFAHESLVELESVSMRRYGRSSIVHKNPVALAIGRFSTMTGVMIGLIVSLLLLVIKSTAKDFLKTYSLDWIIDVLLFLIFIVIVIQYIQKKRKN